MKKVRKSVFETNSSSTHSIHIDSKTKLYDTILPEDDGTIALNGGEFGWEWEKTNNAMTKANYMAVFVLDNKEMTDMLTEVLKEHTGATEIKYNMSSNWDSYNHSCIDHQSSAGEGGDGGKAFNSKEELKDFIFSKNSWLYRGNDNDSAPLNYYIESLQKKFIVKIEGFSEFAYADDIIGHELNDVIDAILRENKVISSSYNDSWDSIVLERDKNKVIIERHYYSSNKPVETVGEYRYTVLAVPEGGLNIEQKQVL